jgi:ABC-type lipoprotein export system ATPase subunit
MTDALPAIDVREVSATYFERGSRLPVLDRISLTVNSGEFEAEIGPS